MADGLVKMKIIAYSDDEFKDEVADGAYTAQVNPEKYTFKYKVEQNEDQAPGTSATQIKFSKIKPEEMGFQFLFDSTGVIPANAGSPDATVSNSEDGIIGKIEHFKKVVLSYNGEVHQPNNLKLIWGELLFKGKLTEMDIEFKLFRPDGTPIRAIANAKFKGSMENELRVAKENAQSPDVKHTRTIADGDSLPFLTYRIYKNPDYYLEVARANNLTNFRKLRTGDQLQFPPVNKS